MDITFIPNLVYYIKTGKWIDVHAKVAEENCITRSTAEKEAIRCCFNAARADVDNVESWDACHNIYNNDIPPAVLAEFCVNANIDDVDNLLNAVYGHGEFNEASKKSFNTVLVLGKRNSLDKINYKLESIRNNTVREFLQTHNYDIELAQKTFNWSKHKKHYWKKAIEEGRV